MGPTRESGVMGPACTPATAMGLGAMWALGRSETPSLPFRRSCSCRNQTWGSLEVLSACLEVDEQPSTWRGPAQADEGQVLWACGEVVCQERHRTVAFGCSLDQGAEQRANLGRLESAGAFSSQAM